MTDAHLRIWIDRGYGQRGRNMSPFDRMETVCLIAAVACLLTLAPLAAMAIYCARMAEFYS